MKLYVFSSSQSEDMGSSEEHRERSRLMIHWTPLDGALQVIGSRPQVLDKLLSTNRWIDKAHQQSTHDYLRYYVSAHQRD